MKKLLKVGTTEWFHTNELSKNEISELAEQYNLHHIIVEDMEEASTQDKIDVYDSCLFVVLHFPKFERENSMHITNEFNCILWKNYIATITKMKTSIIERIKEEYTEELQEDKEEWNDIKYKVSPYYILYRIIDGMYDKTLSGLRFFTNDLRSIEQNIFRQNINTTASLEALLKKRRSIVAVKHCIQPQSEIITELQKETEKLYGWDLDVYFEDLLYKIDKILALVHSLQEELDSLYDTANTLTNIKINKTMKIFTIFTAIIWVLTFVSGMYGMNVKLPWQDVEHMFYLIIVMMAIVIWSLLFYFHKKSWLA